MVKLNAVWAVAALALTSCKGDNGWNLKARATEACARSHENVTPFWRAGEKDMPEFAALLRVTRDEWLKDCAPILAEALKPCTEYAFGTDSALNCMGRRGEPALQLALNVVCAKSVPPGKVHDACEAEVAASRGDLRAVQEIMQRQ